MPQAKERMVQVCGACGHFYSAIATVELGPNVDAAQLLDAQAVHMKELRPRCPKCSAAPPVWGFERHPVYERGAGSSARAVDRMRAGEAVPGGFTVIQGDGIKGASCDHKFLGSNTCAKCGWKVPR